MTNPSSIPVHGPRKVTLDRMLASIPEDARNVIQAENLAREIWNLCNREKVFINPLVPWAISAHETNRWRSDVWRDYTNPCGLKTANASDYVKFINGIDAARAMVVHILMYADGKAGNLGKYRKLDPRASKVVAAGYAGTVTTIEDFRDKWAEDHHWPEGVVNRYNEIRTLDISNPGEPTYKPNYELITNRVVPTGRLNTPNLALNPQRMAVHQTGNTSIGADASMHNTFLWNGGGPESVSFHWVVDDHSVWQNVNTEMVTWQAGDGYNGVGNREAESWELCVNQDGDYLQTLHNAAHHQATRIKSRGWTVDDAFRPAQHNKYSGKDCPMQIRASSYDVSWSEYVSLVRYYFGRL